MKSPLVRRFVAAISLSLGIVVAPLSLHPALADMPRGDAAEHGLSKERLKRVDEVINTHIALGHMSGATALVARDGEVVHFGTYGKQNLETGADTQEDTIYRIYSMTKPITGVAMMMLYEEGKFKLTDPVEMYIPEFKDLQVFAGVNEDGSLKTEPQKQKMTILDLMRHTAGMTYGIFSDTPVDQALRAQMEAGAATVTNQSMLQSMAEVPLLFQPGTRWHYSLSVDVQGALVERLSGMTLGQFFETRIFEPLGMKDTGFWVPNKDMDRFAELYTFSQEGKLVPVPAGGSLSLKQTEDDKPTWESGGGGLVSTTEDYWRFAQMLLDGGEFEGKRLLSETSIDMMRVDHTARYGINMGGLDTQGYGFGLNFGVILDPLKTGTYASVGEYNWGGAAKTLFWIDPAEDLVVIMMTQLLVPSELIDFRSGMRRAVYQAIVE